MNEYYFIVVDKDGKRYGKKEVCNEKTAVETATSLMQKYVFCHYYNSKEWQNECAMLWYFRSVLEYYGSFNDKI